jgi:GT2 family glycosyltransferase
MSFSVVIPSRNAANLTACVRAIREADETCRIIVVDDGVDWPTDEPPAAWGNFEAIMGNRPFIFSRNVNIGIQWADTDDVLLLNDDAVLVTPHGFTRLAEECARGGWGLVASTCNNVGNENQFRRRIPDQMHARPEPRMVCFAAVYIPRATIEAVGLLDERFVDYGCEDDDYCLRVRSAGLKIGIFDGCFVDHGSLTSSFRSAAGAGGNFKPNLARFIEKWGFDNRGLSYEASPWKHLWP